MNIYLQIQQFIQKYKELITNIQNTPLYKLFIFMIFIFNYKPIKPVNIILLYIFKILCIAITIIMPISLVIYTILMIKNIINKNKQYWWKENRFYYHNSKYDYIIQLFKIIENVVLSQRITIYTVTSLSLIIMLGLIKFKFSDLISGGDISYKYKKYLIYTTSIFIIIFFIIIIYLIINFRKYNRVYKFNKSINEKYLKYLNKDYLKIICNNFVDENNIFTNICNIKKLPTSEDLRNYLNTLNISSVNNYNVDLNNNENNTMDNKISNQFLSALITHQWLIFIYENQSYPETKENKMCRQFKLDTIMNDKMYNIFYCYSETIQHPFESNIEDKILRMNDFSSSLFTDDNYKVYIKIIDKYLSINNEMSINISNIKKEDINEINLLIIIFIILIFYTIGLFLLSDSN